MAKVYKLRLKAGAHQHGEVMLTQGTEFESGTNFAEVFGHAKFEVLEEREVVEKSEKSEKTDKAEGSKK